jgi:LPXTG-motif cell wall-anchored protein
MLFLVALGMAAVGLGWVAVRRKRKASQQAATDR